MSDERWLEAVADEARREARDPFADPRWDRLADGTITPEERADLEALAAVPGPYQDAMRAFAPLSSALREEVARKVAGTNVVPMRRRWMAAAAGLAAAAAIVLALQVPQDEPLPSYALQLSGGAQQVRGRADEQLSHSPGASMRRLPRFSPNTRFELVARPHERASGPIAAAGVFVGNGIRVGWRPPIERSSDGVVRIRGVAKDVLPLGPGEWTMTLVIGRPAAVEEAARALEIGGAAPAGVSVLTSSFEVIAPP